MINKTDLCDILIIETIPFIVLKRSEDEKNRNSSSLHCSYYFKSTD